MVRRTKENLREANDTYDNDIDFGADHPTDITKAELKKIGDWLDSGATR